MKLLYKLLTFTLFISFSSYSQTNCWEEVWSEEFETDGLPDSRKWGYDLGGGGWGNNELQTYTNNLENAKVENGRLFITAIKKDNKWTSARLVSREKGDWLYGRIEVKAKLPAPARGTWSAIWMLPTDWEYGGWPKSGEIDIMENVGYDPLNVVGTVHTDAYNHSKGTQKGKTINVADNATAFHIYAVEWYTDSILFFVDDSLYHKFENEHKTFAEWPFDKRHHLLLNMAIGGNWGGSQGIDPNFTSATMEVDYVKVYQNKSTMRLSGESETVKSQAGMIFRAPYAEHFSYEWEVPAGVEIVGTATDSVLTVNWGCESGKVICKITGGCEPIELEHEVTVKELQISGTKFIKENAKGVEFWVDSVANTTYAWTVPEGVTIVSGDTTHKIKVNWNNTSGTVSLKTTNSCGEAEVSFETLVGQYPYPDINTPHAIPGSIQAVDYDYGGAGEAYHDTSEDNEGPGIRQEESVDTEMSDNTQPNVGWITNSEWLEYTVNVAESDWYEATIRAGSAGVPDSMSISFNSVVKFKPVKIKATGSWATFNNQSLGKAYLEAGKYIMRYNFHKGGYNIGKITFAVTTAPITPNPPTPPPPTGIEEKFPFARLYPNPGTGKLYLSGVQNVSKIIVVDVVGHRHSVGFVKMQEGMYEVNMGNMPKGYYTLQAKSGKDIFQKKILIK